MGASQGSDEFSGFWRSTFRYEDPENPNVVHEEIHLLSIHSIGKKIVLQSVPVTTSYFVARLTVDDRIATGSWEMQGLSIPDYEGARVWGALQLILDDDGQGASGMWVGFGNELRVKAGTMRMQLVKIDLQATPSREKITDNLAKASRSIRGIWSTTYTYHNSARDIDLESKHYVKVRTIDNLVVMETLSDFNDSYMLAKFSQNEDTLTGTWMEKTSTTGDYKGVVYHGAAQLVLSEDSKTIKGKWIGFGKNMEVKTGDWQFIYLGEDPSFILDHAKGQ